jgi:glycosyltransferase involved in cell wall biosynthesis
MHASLTRQSVPWEAVIALDGASPDRLPIPLARDPRVRTLALPRPVGAACARNLALAHVRTRYTNWADDDDEFTDDAMSVRLTTLESTGVGWCAGWRQDQHADGSTRLWRCPTPPGRHEAGDVWTYWKSPADTIPIGPTTILARTDLVRAAPMGGLVQGETPHDANGSSCGGEFGGKRSVLVERFVVLDAVVELADHAVEEVALSGCVPVSVLSSSPVVGVGSG